MGVCCGSNLFLYSKLLGIDAKLPSTTIFYSLALQKPKIYNLPLMKSSSRKTYTLFVLLLFFSASLFAQDNTGKLAPEDWKELNEGKIITKKRRTGNKIIAVAQGIVVADSKTIFDVIMECEKQKYFMPNFGGCETYYKDADSIYGKTIIDLPLTKKNLSFILFTRYKYTKRSSKISWSMDTSRKHPSYIADTYGFWEIQEINSGKNLVSFYSSNDFNFHWTINWFLEPISKALIKNGLPDLVKNVRARVESGQTWKLGDKVPKPKIIPPPESENN